MSKEDKPGKEIADEMRQASKKHNRVTISDIKHTIKQGYCFIRDFLTASALTVLIAYSVNNVVRYQEKYSPIQIAVVFSGTLIFGLALGAWSKVIRNYNSK